MMPELAIPAFMVPGWRTSRAIEAGVERNILFRTWGGIGDQICAEPTIRYALRTFKGCKISLASEQPSFFRHLPFERVYDLRDVQPLWQNYLTFDTIRPPSDLAWEFYSHMLVNCVDYVSLCALRCQLPIAEREVMLSPSPEDFGRIDALGLYLDMCVIVHAGRHWQSKTFPKEWWDSVLAAIQSRGVTPVLIGGDADDNRGTVAVDPSGCIDLRGKMSMLETVALLKRSKVLLTNDSAPLHMAVDSDAWIGFVATCKHPDMIMHWRRKQWGWRMENLGLGGIWDVIDYCPNVKNNVEAENVGDHLLRWLPSPEDFAAWGISKLL